MELAMNAKLKELQFGVSRATGDRIALVREDVLLICDVVGVFAPLAEGLREFAVKKPVSRPDEGVFSYVDLLVKDAEHLLSIACGADEPKIEPEPEPEPEPEDEIEDASEGEAEVAIESEEDSEDVQG